MTTTILSTPSAISPLRIRTLPRNGRPRTGRANPPCQKSNWAIHSLILGHHYQQDEVIRFADLRGDSFKLSKLAAQNTACRSIVFCGVHFMAETADILSRDEVQVYLPDLAAGCSMADMADLDSVEAAWRDLGRRDRRKRLDAGNLRQLFRGSQSVLRTARRHRLHQLECPGRPGLGICPTSTRPFLSRTSTSGAIRPDGWESRSRR